MFIDEGASRPSAAGFYVPFLGSGDSVTVGGGCGGGETQGPFDIEGGKVVRCGLMFGRTWLSRADVSLGALGPNQEPAGVIYATVRHDGTGGTPALEVNAGPSLPQSTLDASHRLLYAAEGDAGSRRWADYRSAITVMSME